MLGSGKSHTSVEAQNEIQKQGRKGEIAQMSRLVHPLLHATDLVSVEPTAGSLQ